MLESERAQRTRSEALRDTAAALTRSLSFDELLDRILASIGHVLAHDEAGVWLIVDRIARLVRISGAGAGEIHGDHVSISVDQLRDLRTMCDTGLPLVIPDTWSYVDWINLPGSEWVRSYSGAPLRMRGQVIGLLTLASQTVGFYKQADAEMLQAFADQAAAAIENARLYEEVRRYATELERRVAERTTELQGANDSLAAAAERLKELDRFKSQFVSNVLHELRTPLTNIETYLYLFEKGKPEKSEHYLATLRREVNLLHRLIEDLLYLSRMDLGRVQPALEPVDVNNWITQMADDRSVVFSERQLALQICTQPELPPALVDDKLLTQVLNNLLTNALNYTPSHGTISLKSAALPDTGQNWVTFSVCDTGPGIAFEDMPHIFERFYRGRAGHDSRAPGTGLGLAICDEIVQRLNGKIVVDSQPGQGSTFTVWLPAADHALAQPPEQTEMLR